jgi:uncharacterized protein (DUF427 family)
MKAFDFPKTFVESSKRWVRVKFGGEYIADSKRPMLLVQYGPGRLPTYFFAESEIRMDLLEEPRELEGKKFWTIGVNGKSATGAAWKFLAPPDELADLEDMITFEWDKMDNWYEEEEEVFVHARDPYKRVDVMPSSRHVRVEIDGTVVAESKRPSLLFETSLPVRYYLPKEDVDMSYLEPTDTRSRCPYKGIARYWSVRVGNNAHEDIAWSYPEPIPENPKIKGLVCFFNERVDIYLDGRLEERPFSPWSR